MQPTRSTHLFQLAPQPRHAIADQAAVCLDLRLAGAAEKAEAAALALQMGPAAHEASGLIVEMRELDLQPPLGGSGALAEDFEDEAGNGR